MIKLAYILALTVALAAADGARAGASSADAETAGASHARKKNPGDMSYRAALRLQNKVAALQPRQAQLIAPSLRLAIAGMDHAERAEFLPAGWGVAIVGKTVDTLVPMRRGGFFSVPALTHAQSRQEDAIVMFNAQSRKNSVDVGWYVHVPASGKLAYRQFGQALEEMKQAQAAIAWWDLPLAGEKRARFNALRACFSTGDGTILVAGRPSGRKLSAHCSLLAFDPERLGADPAIAFQGQLDYVALDDSAHYPSDDIDAAPDDRKLSEALRGAPRQMR